MRRPNIFISMCLSVLATAVIIAPSSAQVLPPRNQIEQVLAPLAVGEFDGAFGSHFVVEMWVRNDADVPAQIFRLFCGSSPNFPRGCVPTSSPADPIPARTTVQVRPLNNGYGTFKIGEFFWVEKGASPHVFFSLRVRDISRSSLSAGVEIPTPRESEGPWKMRQELLNVPLETGFRHSLRIYTHDYLNPQPAVISNRVRIYDMETDALLVDDSIPFAGYEFESSNSYTIEPFPNAYAFFLDKYGAQLQGHMKARLEIESNFYSFWAFIAVANDLTQEITVIAP